ncbi:hypothetical protein [Cohnella silvisoli]|uniref:Uncharacterized protein n=1 Tax=Cohnella silvisoli TaxID=2873699 RepID=A0ABV1KS21_9BACL|nr:hypothetical protein [Cohnella silvisoli]MCD9022605.1 hypothetical protein [Cohnella silvisoli]
MNSVLTLVNAEKLEEAYQVYEDILLEESDSSSKQAIKKINGKLISEVEIRVDKYIDNAIDYHAANNLIQELKPFESLKNALKDNQQRLDKFKKSKDAYENANKLRDNKDFGNAIIKYKEVISEDTENYSASAEKIQLSIKEMFDYVLGNSERLFAEKKYEEAYNETKSLDEFYPNDTTIKTKQDAYLQALYEDNKNQANRHVSSKQYDEAINILELTKKYFPDDSELTQKITEVEALKKKAIEEEKIRKEKRKKELLAQVTSKFDDMTKLTTIVPKGYSAMYVNISSRINIESRIRIVDGSAAFTVIAGFEQDNWVFTDKIIFNVDGELFNWEIAYGDRQSQVQYGGIAEWVTQHSFSNNDLINQMQKVANGKSVKMRFDGSEGHRDHVVSESEKSNMKLILELYTYYDNLDDLQKETAEDVT